MAINIDNIMSIGKITKASIYNYVAALQLTQKNFSLADNTTTIEWKMTLTYPSGGTIIAINQRKLVITIDGVREEFSVDINGSTGTKTLKTGTRTIKHNNDGSKGLNYSFSLQWDVIGDSTATLAQSGFATLIKIPRPLSIISADDFTDEENPTITYGGAADELENIEKLEACISFYQNPSDSFDYDNIPYREIDLSAGAYTFELTSKERQTLIDAFNNEGVIKQTVYFYLRTTMSNGYVETKSMARTCSIVNHYPELSPTVRDINSMTAGLTGSAQTKMIKGYSKAEFNLGATFRKGATAEYYTIQNGSQILDDYTSASGTLPNPITSNTFYFSVKDTRGTIVNSFKTVTLINYVPLTCSVTSGHMNGEGVITATIRGNYFNNTFGAEHNTLQLQYTLEDMSGNIVEGITTRESGWVELGDITAQTTLSGNSYEYNIRVLNTNGAIDYNSNYVLVVNINDALVTKQVRCPIAPATPVFDWSRDDFKHNTPVYFDKDIYCKNVYINSERLDNFVIDEGKDSGWYYRMWNNGRVDLVGTQSINNIACNTALGGWYRTAVLSAPNFPFPVNNPIVTATYESNGTGALVWATTKSTTSAPFNLYLIRATSSAGITGVVNYSVSGSWK